MNVGVHRGLDAGMPKQFLKHLRRHSAFNGSCRIRVAQRMHAERFNSRLLTELVQICVIRTVFSGFSGTEVDEDEVSHDQLFILPGSAIQVLQFLIKRRRFFLFQPFRPDFLKNFNSPVCQRNCPITMFRLRRSGTPAFLLVPVFQRLINCQRFILKVNDIPGKPDQLSCTQPRLQDQSILMIIVRTFCSFQKLLLFLNGQKTDIIAFLDRP